MTSIVAADVSFHDIDESIRCAHTLIGPDPSIQQYFYLSIRFGPGLTQPRDCPQQALVPLPPFAALSPAGFDRQLKNALDAIDAFIGVLIFLLRPLVFLLTLFFALVL